MRAAGIAAILACAMLAAAGVGWVTRDGPGISPDSAHYFAGAQNLGAGQGYVTYDDSLITLWPPLYSAVICALGSVGVDSPAAARTINAVSVGGMVLLAGCWLWSATNRLWVGIVGAVLVVTADPLLRTGCMVWSGVLYGLMGTTCVVLMERFAGQHGMRRVVLVGALAGLACLARYIGVTLVFAGALVLLLNRHLTWRSRIGRVLVFGAVASIPLLLWLGRNYLAVGYLTGPRYPGVETFLSSADKTGKMLAIWAMPWSIAYGTGGVVWLVLILPTLIVLTCGAFCLRRREQDRAYFYLPVIGPIYIAVYVAFLVFSAARTVVDLHPRMLSPLYPVGIMIAMSATAWLGRSVRTRRQTLRRPCIAGLIVVVAGMCLWGGLGIVRYMDRLGRPPIAEGLSAWRDSDTMVEFSRRSGIGPVMSNSPEYIYLFTGRDAQLGPRIHPYGSPGVDVRADEIDRVRAFLHEYGPVRFYWFEGGRSYVMSPPEMAEHFTVDLLARRRDGAIYRVAVRTPGPDSGEKPSRTYQPKEDT